MSAEILFKGSLVNGYPVPESPAVIELAGIDPRAGYGGGVYTVAGEDDGKLLQITAWATFQQGASEERTSGHVQLVVNGNVVRYPSYTAKDDPPVSCPVPTFTYVATAGDTIQLKLEAWTPVNGGNILGDDGFPRTGMEIVAICG